MPSIAEHLRAVPIFGALDEEALTHVSDLATEFAVDAGHVLMERGQAGSGVFVIQEGTARVDLPDGSHLERGPGDFVGELAVLADTPRSARVSAVTALQGFAIRRDDLVALLEHRPAIALAMLHQLAHRLVEMTSKSGD